MKNYLALPVFYALLTSAYSGDKQNDLDRHQNRYVDHYSPKKNDEFSSHRSRSSERDVKSRKRSRSPSKEERYTKRHKQSDDDRPVNIQDLEIDILKTQVDRLKADARNQSEIIKKHEKYKEQVTTDLDTLRQGIEERRKKNKEYEEKIKDQSTKNQTLTDDLIAAQKKINELKDQLSEKNQKIASLLTWIKEKEKFLNEMSAEAARFKSPASIIGIPFPVNVFSTEASELPQSIIASSTSTNSHTQLPDEQTSTPSLPNDDARQNLQTPPRPRVLKFRYFDKTQKIQEVLSVLEEGKIRDTPHTNTTLSASTRKSQSPALLRNSVTLDFSTDIFDKVLQGISQLQEKGTLIIKAKMLNKEQTTRIVGQLKPFRLKPIEELQIHYQSETNTDVVTDVHNIYNPLVLSKIVFHIPQQSFMYAIFSKLSNRTIEHMDFWEIWPASINNFLIKISEVDAPILKTINISFHKNLKFDFLKNGKNYSTVIQSIRKNFKQLTAFHLTDSNSYLANLMSENT